jgi:hypothetical protein
MSDDEPACQFTITRPPSTNALYINPTGRQIRSIGGKRVTPGRLKSQAYKAWIDTAGWEMNEQHVGRPGYPSLRLLHIEGIAGIDSDNIKAIPDLLKRMGVIADDKLIDRIILDRGDVGGKTVTVSIWPLDSRERLLADLAQP